MQLLTGLVLWSDVPEEMYLCPLVIWKAPYCPERKRNLVSSHAAMREMESQKDNPVLPYLSSEQMCNSALKLTFDVSTRIHKVRLEKKE